MKTKKVIMYAGLFLLWTFTQTANAQGLKFRVVSFGEDPFDLAARSEQYQEVDGSGSLYAIIKVTSETPDDDVSAYQYNFGMMNHKVKEHNGEVWVYVQKNAKTVTLSRQGYQTISRYDLGTTIEAGKTYKMILSAQAASVQHCILQFSVDPPGENAIVKVKREGDDGDYDLWGTVDATGGLAKRLEAGTYLYEIVAEHYDRTEGRIPLNGSESKHVERVTLTPNFGYLVVDDANGITGADVYVNDRKIGTVPYTSKDRWDVRDDYRIMVSKGDMYKTYSSTFAIRKGETTKIIPVLEADFAQITLQVANNAEIWIEDENKGTGKWSGPLRAGIYNVECRLDRHRTTRRAITVTANQSETFTLDAPTPITGSIYVNSNPLGATIKLDGKECGTTPSELKDILIGQYTLILNKESFNEERRVIDVREGETTEIEVTMSEKSNSAQPDTLPSERTFNVNGVSFTMKLVESYETFLEKEARKTYQNTAERFAGQDLLTASHILVLMRQDADAKAQAAAKARIDSIYAVLQGGADFAEVAKNCSDDKGSAARGGELGQFGKGMMVPDFEKAAYELQAGEMSVPVKTTLGWHIIKVADRHPFEPYEFHRAKIIDFLEQRGIADKKFKMGYEDGWGDEKPVHEVSLSDYYIGETEVTQALWQALMGTTIRQQQNKVGWELVGEGANYPMYYVSWDECQEFIRKLNAKTGLHFRLPTEAEWEFAARGGTKTHGYLYSGSDDINEVAWNPNNSNDMTHPVKLKLPNELGLYDMSGNVWEWCQDWFGPYSSNAQTNPKGPASGSARVDRGGCYGVPDNSYCYVSYRGDHRDPSHRGPYLGFRLALDK